MFFPLSQFDKKHSSGQQGSVKVKLHFSVSSCDSSALRKSQHARRCRKIK